MQRDRNLIPEITLGQAAKQLDLPTEILKELLDDGTVPGTPMPRGQWNVNATICPSGLWSSRTWSGAIARRSQARALLPLLCRLPLRHAAPVESDGPQMGSSGPVGDSASITLVSCGARLSPPALGEHCRSGPSG